eukprot:4051860-Prymnesium_polylepis.2
MWSTARWAIAERVAAPWLAARSGTAPMVVTTTGGRWIPLALRGLAAVGTGMRAHATLCGGGPNVPCGVMLSCDVVVCATGVVVRVRCRDRRVGTVWVSTTYDEVGGGPCHATGFGRRGEGRCAAAARPRARPRCAHGPKLRQVDLTGERSRGG